MTPLFKLSATADWNFKLTHNLQVSSISPQNDLQVTGINLKENWSMAIKNAIILGNNSDQAIKSMEFFDLVVDQLESHNLTTTLAPEFRDSVVIRNIVIPLSHAAKDQTSWHHQVRLMNHRLEYHEISRIFDHMAAWYHIITKTRGPTVILESNVRLLRTLPYHLPRNSIIGLDTGGKLHEHNLNYKVMPGVWAYSIDQFAARKMFDRVIEQGIREPLELMFRADQQLIVLGSSCARQV